MSRAIKIETVRVGDVRVGDVLRFAHPLDRPSKARQSNWLQVLARRLTDEGKVVLTLDTSALKPTEKVFRTPYELVEVQVPAKAGTPDEIVSELAEQLGWATDEETV